jgi:uncharacterized damage-inducible protein DinB
MTDKTKEQVLQKKIKSLRTRIDHMKLLTGQIRDEVTALGNDISDELNNQLQTDAMELENARQDMAYQISRQEDILKQQENEPLIIKEGKSEANK